MAEMTKVTEPRPTANLRRPSADPGDPALRRRLRVDVHLSSLGRSDLARDVRAGLSSPQKWLPPKYFYDDHGSRLFDAICDLPEYYLTRTEQALLDEVSDEIVTLARARDLVEFGSGASRKTRLLLSAMHRHTGAIRYVPIDVSEAMLRRSSESCWQTILGWRSTASWATMSATSIICRREIGGWWSSWAARSATSRLRQRWIS
jgi:uncharacterized SAM-dependent methyltransferase